MIEVDRGLSQYAELIVESKIIGQHKVFAKLNREDATVGETESRELSQRGKFAAGPIVFVQAWDSFRKPLKASRFLAFTELSREAAHFCKNIRSRNHAGKQPDDPLKQVEVILSELDCSLEARDMFSIEAADNQQQENVGVYQQAACTVFGY